MVTSFSSSTISYFEILDQIYNMPKSAVGARSLSTMQDLCAHFGHPEKSFPSVHVAGTNGKGSVCTKIAKALQNQGYRTGLYTSPHITSFCERIQINGVPIAEEEICQIYSHIQKAISACGATPAFFEIATLFAFLYFQKSQVEIAVIETGLGGAYDATNIISPLVSVITSIGYDHKEILGTTLKEICKAKAGILKPLTPIVLGRTVPTDWILPAAKEKQCRLSQAMSSHPNYDAENQETARIALEAISELFPIQPAALEEGLMAIPCCRFEHMQFKRKEVILDVAHNPQGFERLLERLRLTYPNKPFRFICGFSKGKEIAECARLIEANASAIHLVSAPHPRLATIQELTPYFSSSPHIFQEHSIAEGIQNACKSLLEPEIIVITGSFFIMNEARRTIFQKQPQSLLPYPPKKTNSQ